jgi:hypothetical protein
VTAPTVPSPEAARAERKSPPEIDKEIGGGRVPAAPPPPPPPALAAKPEARVAVSDSLAIPSTLTTPIALDYDSVSKRFVFADDGSETLKVVDELSGNAVDLVSRGWAKAFRTTALVIDARRGDLWVASTQGDTSPRGAVHRLQLVSGRLLYTVEMPEAAAPSRFVDVALDGTNVLVLDSTGRRIYEVASGSRKLQLRTPVEIDRDLTSLAPAGDGIVYVAHADGLLRVQLGARRTDAIKAGAKIDLRGLEWIRHQQGRLLGIQRRDDGTRVVVSIRLDRRRRTAIALDVVDVTHAPRAAVSGTHLYFVGATATGPTMKRVELR